MKKIRILSVSLLPSKNSGEGCVTTVGFFSDTPKTRIEACTLDEIETKVKDFANEYGFGCAATVRFVDGGKKLPGFDARFRSLYYNLDKPDPEHFNERVGL